ncbi:MAG: RNA polymerase sigma-70 factor [Prolixibacteraceae bacterium]|jgi:RNA polymerase sigma-70 factor (ECF subfamily)|nr:MAG: ECF RNA polymerase sigma factor RpoE [Bacteroidetes bacterium ADurb.Bin123]HOF56236.1 RNA polymerase sigma-70 factor [Prolixibacteraceae bacterium]HOS01274.1 RNA polymerase sigma-70 factor [Prolixibacteraceae bacterium]HOS91322.1 RNA polymerase sigma-70 factor [Prolixibacteraceae bacterium]HPL46364.1 RNA polymerase sigma-70 factor [Prolixibacteraceae bacterium]
MDLNRNISDDELIEKLRKGDLEAIDIVFEKYGNRLFGFAMKYLKSKEEAESLVQDVFLTIWENHKKLKKDSSLKSYLFTISYHNICKIFRKRQLQGKLRVEIGLGSDVSVDTEEQIDYDFTLEQIENLIEQLPPKQKIIFLKSRKEGKSTREIAKELHLAPGTVDNNISAALKFLRKHVSGDNLARSLFCLTLIR